MIYGTSYGIVSQINPLQLAFGHSLLKIVLLTRQKGSVCHCRKIIIQIMPFKPSFMPWIHHDNLHLIKVTLLILLHPGKVIIEVEIHPVANYMFSSEENVSCFYVGESIKCVGRIWVLVEILNPSLSFSPLWCYARFPNSLSFVASCKGPIKEPLLQIVQSLMVWAL